MFEGYDFDAEDLSTELGSRGWTRVVLQAPEGLVRDSLELGFFLQKRGFETCLMLDPCYGACDLAHAPDGWHGVVHLGHAPLPGQNALFVELHSHAHSLAALKTLNLPPRVGLVATVQHLHLLPMAKDILESRGIAVVVGRRDDDSRTAHDGQVLGCDISAARSIAGHVDAYVVLASGVFHARGVAAATCKLAFAIDPYSGMPTKEDGQRLLRQRHGLIESARNGKRFGILVSSKTGQRRQDEAKFLIAELTKDGREAILLQAGNIRPEIFSGMGLDVLVSTACPRIALDDFSNYPIPVLTPVDVMVLLGLLAWEEYRMDEILFNRERSCGEW